MRLASSVESQAGVVVVVTVPRLNPCMAVGPNAAEHCIDGSVEVGRGDLGKATALGLAGAISTPEGHMIMEHKELAAILFAFLAVVHVWAVEAALAARLLVGINKLGLHLVLHLVLLGDLDALLLRGEELAVG